MKLAFQKMHGLGNDFVVIDATDSPINLTQEQISLLGDRRYGVGFDQLMLLVPAEDEAADVRLRLFNADGREIEACGNGTRCAAHLWMVKNNRDRCVIKTLAGYLECRLAGGNRVAVDMGAPKLGWADIPLAKAGDPADLAFPGKIAVPGVAVSMGNPHVVFFVDDVNTVDLETIGPAIETDPIFPEKANVEFAQVLAPDQIRMRVWERGAGVTHACGSGACATLVAAVLKDKAARKAEIILDGGSLEIEWRAEDGHVLMTGPVAYVFFGEIDL